MQYIEIKVTGKVQGVGFRYFTKSKAIEFDISGWVRNSPDGGVLIIAQGLEIDLQTFVDWIKIGPQLSRVDKITSNRFDQFQEFKNFEIRY